MKKIVSITTTFILVICFGVTNVLSFPSTANQNSKSITPPILLDDVLPLLNAERAKNNLSALSIDDDLEYVAEVRARELTFKQSHTRPNNTSVFDMLDKLKSEIFLENNYENTSAEYIVNTWMSNPETKADILNPNYDIISVYSDAVLNNDLNYMTVLLLGDSKGDSFKNTSTREKQVNEFVTRLYNVFLDRQPDSAGLTNHATPLINRTGFGVGQTLYDFVSSPEFVNKQYSDEQIVEKFYQGFFGRNSDAAGKSMWVDFITKGTSIPDIARGFTYSMEYVLMCSSYDVNPSLFPVVNYNDDVFRTARIQTFVTRLYTVFLERDPDEAGFQHHLDKLLVGSYEYTQPEYSAASVIGDFVLGPEFINSNYSNEQKVEKLYQGYFGRSSDAVGKAYWMHCLDSGMPMTEVSRNFTHSQEYINMCKYYNIMPGSL